MRSPELNRQFTRIERSINRLVAAIFFAVFGLAAIQFYMDGSILPAGGLALGALIALIAVLLP
jgi:hypothetical protein